MSSLNKAAFSCLRIPVKIHKEKTKAKQTNKQNSLIFIKIFSWQKVMQELDQIGDCFFSQQSAVSQFLQREKEISPD